MAKFLFSSCHNKCHDSQGSFPSFHLPPPLHSLTVCFTLWVWTAPFRFITIEKKRSFYFLLFKNYLQHLERSEASFRLVVMENGFVVFLIIVLFKKKQLFYYSLYNYVHVCILKFFIELEVFGKYWVSDIKNSTYTHFL